MDALPALLETADDGSTVLAAPKLGHFSPSLHAGDFVRAGSQLGELRILNRRFKVVAPHGATGLVEDLVPAPGRGVQYKELLVRLGGSIEASASQAAAVAQTEEAAEGLVVKAPIHGIFYGRPSPEADAYVLPGDTVSAGQTVGLVEVMKTFNPVAYGGPDLPNEAKVVQVLAKDQQEVEAGQALLIVEEV